MGKKNKKKEGSSSKKVVEHQGISDIKSNEKEEKVSAIGRYMKKMRAQEKTKDDKAAEKVSSEYKKL